LIYALKKIFSIKKNTFLLRKYSLILVYKKKERKPARNCRFFFASSMSVYGNLRKKVNENDPTNPISFYGLSKLSSEKYIKMFSNKKINYPILRFFNVYGQGQILNNLKKH